MKCFRILAAGVLVVLMAGDSQAAFNWNGAYGTPTDSGFAAMNLQDYEVALLPYDSTTDGPGSSSLLVEYSVQDIVQRAIPLGLINTVTGLNSGNSYYPGSTGSIIGDQTYSMFQITSINATPGGQQYWVRTAPNQHLEGFEQGYTLTSYVQGSAGANLNFTDGNVSLYFDGSALTHFNANTGPFSAGWAGISTSNGVGTGTQTQIFGGTGVGGVAADPTITLSSQFGALNTTTGNLAGSGSGFLTQTLDTVFGIPPDILDDLTYSPPYPGDQDIEIQTSFINQPSGYSSPLAFQDSIGWSISSQDSLIAYLDVPEPASFSVWGGLLLGALVVHRRREC